MGSAQSRANESAASDTATASSIGPSPSRSSSQNTEVPRRRLSTFNRLSSFSKRSGSKRDRDARSVARLEQSEAKKARKRDASPMQQQIVESHNTNESEAEDALYPGNAQASSSAIPAASPPLNSNLSTTPNATPPTASVTTLATPAEIQDDMPIASGSSSSHSSTPTVLAPNPLSPSVDRLLNRFRRQSLPSQAIQPRIADRLTALLGFFSPLQTPAQTADEGAVAATPEGRPQLSTAEMIRDVTRRLSDARRELDATQRQIDEARQRMEERDQVRAALEAELSQSARQSNPEATVPMRRRIPAGAVLVIQGLAQTETAPPVPDNASATSVPATSLSSSEGSRPFFPRLRRMSEGNTRQSEERENANGASIETQARMIGGLLTVAAAATASTLLLPDRSSTAAASPTPNRSAAAQALSNLMDRIRPNRLRSSQTVEAALGSYLRGVLRDSRQLDSQATGAVSSADDTDRTDSISDSFQSFLEVLQADLVGSVRAFVAPPEDRADSEAVQTGDSESSSSTAPSGSEHAPIPTFHRQLGQNLPGERNTTGVVGGHDGLPRRLNFFRAHLFPPVSLTAGAATPSGEQPEDTMVPCIFIGVRSISHDPSLTTEDLVQHPSFPFVDGTVPAADPPTELQNHDQPTTPLPPSPEPATSVLSSSSHERRTLRERVLERLTPRRSAPPTALHTYLVYVIGGNYPSDHPVLRIPNLATGGPLTDEEMVLVGELMGSVKPPVATKEDIEKAGLKTLDGAEMVGAAELGEVLASCVERCLICLSEYEQGEECRVLRCRHGFHKECVDHWLEAGRNSCPACRSEAVETGKSGAAGPSPTTAAEPVSPAAAAAAAGAAEARQASEGWSD